MARFLDVLETMILKLRSFAIVLSAIFSIPYQLALGNPCPFAFQRYQEKAEIFSQLYNVKYLSHSRYSPELSQDVEAVGQFYVDQHKAEMDWVAKVIELDLVEQEKKAALQDFENSLTHRLHQGQMILLYGKQIEAGEIANVEIRKVNDIVGYGLFAKERIAMAQFVGEYTGVISPRRRSFDGRNPYLFWTPFAGLSYSHLNADGVFTDAKYEGNETRFINHSRKSANCFSTRVFHMGQWHIIIVASRTIEPGEQLLFDYGYHLGEAAAEGSGG